MKKKKSQTGWERWRFARKWPLCLQEIAGVNVCFSWSPINLFEWMEGLHGRWKGFATEVTSGCVFLSTWGARMKNTRGKPQGIKALLVLLLENNSQSLAFLMVFWRTWRVTRCAANGKQTEDCNPICSLVGVLRTVLLIIKWPNMFLNWLWALLVLGIGMGMYRADNKTPATCKQLKVWHVCQLLW